MESLQGYEGTLILVSHDRWFVSQLATRVVEIRSDGIRDFAGTYDEYVHACGDDHLDADEVALRARREKAPDRAPARPSARTTPVAGGKPGTRQLEHQRDAITDRISGVETGIAGIETRFADPTFYQATPHAEIRDLEDQLGRLRLELEALMREWEALEEQLAARPLRGDQRS